MKLCLKMTVLAFLFQLSNLKPVNAQGVTGSIPDYAEYTISSNAGGKFVEVAGAILQNEKYNNSQKIVQYAASVSDGSNDSWQKWYIVYKTTENNVRYFAIRNAFSGKVISVPNKSTVSGIALEQYSEELVLSASQLWKIGEVSAGVYQVINKNSGLALTNAGSSNTNGTAITQESWNNGNNQKWQLTKQLLDSYRDDDVVRFFERSKSQGSVAFDQGSSILLSNDRTLWVTQDAWDGSSLQSNNMFSCNYFFSYGNSMFVQPNTKNWNSADAPNITRSGSAQGRPKQICDIQPNNSFAWPSTGVEIGNKVYVHCGEGNGLVGSAQSLYVLTENAGTNWAVERTQPAGLVKTDINFGAGMVKQADGFVYVFGTRGTGYGYSLDLHVARFPVSNPQEWTFWNGSAWTDSAVPNASSRVGTGKGSGSVSYLNGKYVFVTMDQGFNCDDTRNIYIKTASTPISGFSSNYINVYSIKENMYGKYARFYNVQIHPQFKNNNDELLISYSLNYSACNVNGCVNGYLDPYFYRIKGVRIPYSKIGIASDNQGPLVSITSPLTNASFTSPATVNIQTSTFDIDGTVSKVEFFNGATKLGEDVTSPFTFDWTGVAAGTYTLTARAVDNDGADFISPAVVVKVNNPTVGNGNGLQGNYFNGKSFETAVYTRIDPTINFNWGNGSPNAVVNANGFSARWIGQVQPRYSGEYTFSITSDNGRRLWINNQLVIDKWIDDWDVEYSGKIILLAGEKYDIKLEYFENYGGANCKLQWSSGDQAMEIIPTSQLYAPAIVVNQLPIINLTSPTTNQSYNAPANITMTATASDPDGSVSRVEFYNGSQKIAEDATAPYSYTWTNLATGNYTISAKVYDDKNASALSSVVSIGVKTLVVSDACSALPNYSENNGYVAASKVRNVGKKYECKEFPYSGWCNGASWAYAPGTGAYWTDAWYDRGSCSAKESDWSTSQTEETILISPNPASDAITIHTEANCQLTIYNMQGIEVKSIMNVSNKEEVNISDLAAGVYTLKIDNGSAVITRMILKK